MEQKHEEDEWLSTQDVATLLGMSHWGVRKWVKFHLLAPKLVGRKWKFSKRAALRVLENRPIMGRKPSRVKKIEAIMHCADIVAASPTKDVGILRIREYARMEEAEQIRVRLEYVSRKEQRTG